MRVEMSTSPKDPHRPNEDFVGATCTGLVLVDGAGVTPPYPGCSHGVAWFAQQLGGHLLALIDDGSRDLASVLAQAIVSTASLHPECDLTDPSAPFGAVAMVRFSATTAEYLVISDAVVLFAGESVQVVRDEREFEFARPHRDGPRDALINVMRSNRNQPGGYWVAAADPQAAAHALTGVVESVGSVVVLSNGASRLVDRYRLASWEDLVDLVFTEGPDELVRRVRSAEDGSVVPDDATAAAISRSPSIRAAR
jgi:hypothetical protein